MLTGLEWARGTDGAFRLLDEWFQRDGARWMIGGKTGGLRTDEAVQASLYAKGREFVAGVWRVVNPAAVVTNAATLLDTPHGRGMGLDYWAVDERGRALPDAHPQWNRIAEAVAWANAEAVTRGLARPGSKLFTWGGAWAKLTDKPHVQLTEWRSRPFAAAPGASLLGVMAALGLAAWWLFKLKK